MGWLIIGALVAALLLCAWSYDRRKRRSGSDYGGISPDEYGTRVRGSMASGKDVKFRRL
jgi:hypothetical protein